MSKMQTEAPHKDLQQPSRDQSSSTSSNETTTSETAVLHSNTNLPDNEVLLKTAIATVASASHVHAEASILFDEGPQKSFITEHLAEELQLTRETTETIYLAAFGSTVSKVQQVDIATVHVTAENRQMIKVRVLVVPTISTPINNRTQHVSELPYLHGLRLAHPGTSDSTYFTESRSMMSNAGMNLRAWTSNSEALRTQADLGKALDSDVNVRILGLRWDPTKDEMSFAERNIPILEVVTERTILRYSSQIYDPLGPLSPVTVRAKILLQDLWTDKYDWNTPLPDQICETWNQLAWSFNKVTESKFARQYLASTCHCSETSLHIFIDASVKSYGAAEYLCDQTQARFVMAMKRVAPLKSLTLLQLELMAALVGARLSSHILETLPTLNVTFWSDSQIVLHWLTTTKALKRFVLSRVEEIKQQTSRLSWRYYPTDDNPADLLNVEYQHRPTLEINYGTADLPGFPTEKNGPPGSLVSQHYRCHLNMQMISRRRRQPFRAYNVLRSQAFTE